jgi:hypothetical protein
VNLSAGPVVWFVDQALIANRATFNLVGGSVLDFTVVYLGTLETQFEQPWNGRLFAPNARVVLGANGNLIYSGQLFVRETEIRPGTTFICRSEEG